METKGNKKSFVLPIIFIFVMMILAATAENVRGVFIPLFKSDFSINDTNIGLMLTISSLGYILFTYIGGILCERLGQKKVFLLGLSCIAISLCGLGLTYNFFLFLIPMFGLNVGLALISIAINTTIPFLFLSFQAVLMNLTHFCYGLGSAVVQRVSGIMLVAGVAWRTIYLAEAVLFLIVLLLFIPVKLPKVKKSKANETAKGSKSSLFRNKLLYFYMLALGFYVFAEMGTGNWFVNYVEKVYYFDKSKSSFYLSLFFGVFTVGRLLGGFAVERIGYIRAVSCSLVIAFIMYLSGIILGAKGMIILSISGFFFAITFPTLVVTISRVFKENSYYATGVIITASSTINMILNMLMGFLNDYIGIQRAYYLLPVGLLISIIFTYAIYRKVKTTIG